MAGHPAELTFIYRSGCHLCEQMWRELEPFRNSPALVIKPLDLASEPSLEDAYGDKIPLLRHSGNEICRYFLDAEKLHCYLQSVHSSG
jgi:hypothetical protein